MMLLLTYLFTQQIDLAAIAARFKELVGKSLDKAIEDETSGDYKKMLLAIVKEKWFCDIVIFLVCDRFMKSAPWLIIIIIV